MVALAVLVFVAGMANAQTFSCTASTGAAPPQLRSEGLTELVGDILLDCSGTGPAGLANFTVYSPAPVTSRVASGNSGISEALLVVNEPVAGAAVLAPNDTTPGCTDVVVGNPALSAIACTYNTFQGSIAVPTATPSVTFLGIPIVPPGTGHVTFRITNVRVNANAYAGGTTGVVPLLVQLAISGTTAVPIPVSPSFTVGFVTRSMVFDGLVNSSGADRTGFELRQCDGIDEDAPIAWLRFRELFATAFKPRGTSAQAQPGFSYNTESGLTPTNGSGAVSSVTAVASWGTRLRATFNNIPLGTEVWVSVANEVITSSSATAGAAVLLTSATTPTTTPGALRTSTYAQIVAADATSGVAIWEVQTPSIPTALETYDFGVFFVADPNPQASPAAGVQGTVTGNYAPTPSSSQAASWGLARTDIIPRFVDPGATDNLILFNLCRTNLLFPYVLGGVGGFDTGIAITNTSTDPWDTTPQSGKCLLNFYGKAAPAVFTTPSIGQKTTDFGAIWSSTALSLAQGFNGYIIAQCDFQYAHGFAFVSDIGAHDIAMGYLALILPDVDGIGSRPVNGLASLATAESLSN